MRLRLGCPCGASFDCDAATAVQVDVFFATWSQAHADCGRADDDETATDKVGAAPDVVSHQGASVSGAQERTPDLIGSGLWADPEENGENARRIGFTR